MSIESMARKVIAASRHRGSWCFEEPRHARMDNNQPIPFGPSPLAEASLCSSIIFSNAF